MNDTIRLFKLKLNRFIDRYYKNLLVKGIPLFLLCFLSSIILFSFLELQFHFCSSIRFIIFTAFLVLQFTSLFYFVFVPLLRLFNIFKRISLEVACRMIQSKNPDLQDTLINILQLSKTSETDLVKASIEQKFSRIKNLDFEKSIKTNCKVHILVLIILFTSSVAFFFSTNLFTVGFNNIIHFSNVPDYNAGYSIYIDNSKLEIPQGSDLSLEVKLKGSNIPNELFVSVRENRFIMEKQNDTLFTYLFKKVNNNFDFFIQNDNFKSSAYSVHVYQTPIITSYKTKIYYPKYVNKTDTTVENQNILIVPQGTFLNTVFYGSYFDTLSVVSLHDSSVVSIPKSDTTIFKKRIYKDENLKIVLSNQKSKCEFVNFKIVCVPDIYPVIDIAPDESLSSSNNMVFTGNIKDDYGFTKLLFFVGDENYFDTISVPIYFNVANQKIFYNYQNNINSDIDDKTVSFYFELFDNDQVNGPKKVRSNISKYVVKSIANQTAEKEKQYDELFRELEYSSQLSFEIEFSISELRQKLLNDNLSDWEKNNLLQQISEKSNQLQDLLSSITQSQNQIQNTLNDNKRIVEKQNLVSEMLNSLVDEELKKILQEISDLAKNQAEQYNTLSENLKKDFGNFEKSIDKDLELLRKIKIEESIQQIADNLNLLSEKQNEISKQPNADSLLNDIETQHDFFNSLKEQYQKTIEDNENLEQKFMMNNFDDAFDNIESEFEKQKQYSGSKDNQNFENSAKENSKKLNKLSDEMNNMINSNNEQEQAENADDLRQILDNLFEVSFNQEYIITNFENVNFSNPNYQDRILSQSQLIDNFKIVKDSLYSLSKRTVYLGNHVLSAAFQIEDNMINSISQLQDRNTYKASQSQHAALKNTNDMILLLSESLKNVQSGSGASGKTMKNKKQKPNKQEQSMSDMRKAQESIKNQMKDLLNQMKSGNSKKINEEMAKSLIQNEIYQQILNQMLYNSDIDGQTSKLLQEVKKLMEKNHADLANKKLSIQTVMRQQNIVTKLLEAENAETEKDKDERRESKTAKNIHGNSKNNLQEDPIFEKNIDFIQQNEIRLNSFFKSKFEEYLNGVNNETYE